MLWTRISFSREPAGQNEPGFQVFCCRCRCGIAIRDGAGAAWHPAHLICRCAGCRCHAKSITMDVLLGRARGPIPGGNRCSRPWDGCVACRGLGRGRVDCRSGGILMIAQAHVNRPDIAGHGSTGNLALKTLLQDSGLKRSARCKMGQYQHLIEHDGAPKDCYPHSRCSIIEPE